MGSGCGVSTERQGSGTRSAIGVFVRERGTPFSTRGFQAMVERGARAAGFDMKIHPHMLR
jgi:site-specific recombinase XerD